MLHLLLHLRPLKLLLRLLLVMHQLLWLQLRPRRLMLLMKLRLNQLGKLLLTHLRRQVTAPRY